MTERIKNQYLKTLDNIDYLIDLHEEDIAEALLRQTELLIEVDYNLGQLIDLGFETLPVTVGLTQAEKSELDIRIARTLSK